MSSPGKSALFLGFDQGTSLHRAHALERLGFAVTIVNPLATLPSSRFLYRWHYETGGRFLEHVVAYRVLSRIGRQSTFDLLWVDGGDLVGPVLLRSLRGRVGRCVNYNLDDPYGTRDHRLWRLYLHAVPFYDAVAVVRDENVDEARRAGARRVVRVYRSADEVAHRPRDLSEADRARWQTDVLFVGTWFPERGPLMKALMARGISPVIYGNRWEKDREWNVLRSLWKGPGLDNVDDYARAIQCAKICLGLVSEGNRDLHTQRSAEIPHLGSLLCGQRTRDHLAMYEDGKEAAFWKDPAECAELCSALLRDEPRRASIAARGQERCRRSRYVNESVLAEILAAAGASAG